MRWFEEWFDSPLYEKLYVNRDEEEALQLIDLLEKTLTLNACSHILDLGCGRGRHSINLAKRGYEVKGIDLSEEAIKKARSKAKEQGIDNVSFAVRDMRDPLPETFDAIVNLFTTFGYFSDDKENTRVLKSITQMLKPGGILVMDYLNAHVVRQSFDSEDSGNFKDVDYAIERYVEEGAIVKDIHFTEQSTGNKKTYSERVKLYEKPWFEQAFMDHGLHIDHIYGNYHGAPFREESSPRLLIVGHRADAADQQA